MEKFKQVKKANSQTGNSPQSWPYYDIFFDLCGNEANVEPVYPCSSINPTPADTVLKEKNSKVVDKSIEEKVDKEMSEEKKEDKSLKKKRSLPEGPIVKKRKTSQEEFFERFEKINKENRQCMNEMGTFMVSEICKTFNNTVAVLAKNANEKEKDK